MASGFITGLLIVVGLALVIFIIYIYRLAMKIKNEDPTFWERSIKKFDNEARTTTIPENAILFTGSSSINYWHTLEEDMDPLVVVNRGFGGSRIFEVTYYLDRIVIPHKPRAVVLYAGENDATGLFVGRKYSGDDILNSYKDFVNKLHSKLQVPIYYISIKPPKSRQKFWGEMKKANELIEEFTKDSDLLHFIDITEVMLRDGEVIKEIFKWDGIHLNEKGYALWVSVIKPILLNDFPIEK